MSIVTPQTSFENAMQRRRKIQPVLTISRIGEKPRDVAYWRTQTPQARLAAVEEIRHEYHGWKPGAEPRIQKVLRIIDLQSYSVD